MEKIEKFLADLEEKHYSFCFNYSAHLQGNKDCLYTSEIVFRANLKDSYQSNCFRHSVEFKALPTEELIMQVALTGAELFEHKLENDESLEWDLYRIHAQKVG